MSPRIGRPTRRRAVRRDDRGQAMVEFALVAPILLLMVLGVVDFSRAWNAYQVITHSARVGARLAVVDNPGVTEQDVVDAIHTSLENAHLDPARASVQVNGFRAGSGTPAGVQIEYPYTLMFVGRFLDWLSGSEDLVLTTNFVMRNE